jgi:hypothetical protein
MRKAGRNLISLAAQPLARDTASASIANPQAMKKTVNRSIFRRMLLKFTAP